MVKIHAVGGFSEVGKNMVAVELEDDAFLFDEGFFMPAIVSMQERDNVMTERKLRNIKAIPDDTVLDKIRHKVRAQFISHAHLDHVGAVPFISDRYNAPVYGTPFTIEVLHSLCEDNDIVLNNKTIAIKPNTTFYVKGKKRKYRVDFINITHSTLQCLMIAIQTPKGVVIYANDFKFDDTPVIGPKPNYKRLREIAKEGVLAIAVDSLYSGSPRKTPSEKIARALLQEVLLTIQNKHAGMIVTTFSSHIARLKSIVEFGKKLNREVVFLGRSLDKYTRAAKNVGTFSFLQDVKVSKYRRQVERTLKKVEKNRSKYLMVCTGHQGEPGSILERISRHQLPFKITKDDNLIFSSSVIPTPENIEQFSKMEAKLKKHKPRIFRDAHVSGHGGREDLRDLMQILHPQHVIPAHGDLSKTQPMAELLKDLGYKVGKNCHLMQSGGSVKIVDAANTQSQNQPQSQTQPQQSAQEQAAQQQASQEQEIMGGLKNALQRGSNMMTAQKSFVNAGYPPALVAQAAQNLAGQHPELLDIKQKPQQPASTTDASQNNTSQPQAQAATKPKPKKMSKLRLMLLIAICVFILGTALFLGVFWERLF